MILAAFFALTMFPAGAASGVSKERDFRLRAIPASDKFIALQPRIEGLFALTEERRWFLVFLNGRQVFLRASPPPIPIKRYDEMLPDGLLVRGANDIVEAWLSRPTKRYGHGVIGDAVEAAELTVKTRNSEIHRLSLTANSVFEDRYPRLVDIDGDGRDEIIVVRSYLKSGAALVVAGLREGKLAIWAETPAIGLPHRWLNPVGVGDFDGDGQREIAYVETPHIGGILKILRWRKNKLMLLHAVPGFSNHAMGSRVLALSAIADLDGDGIEEIILPDAHRGKLRIVHFKAGRFTELARLTLRARINSPLARLKIGGSKRSSVVFLDLDGVLWQIEQL